MIAHTLALYGPHAHLVVAHLDHIARVIAGAKPTPAPPGGAPPSGAPTGLGDALDKIAQIADFISAHFLVIGVSLCTLVFGWGGLLWIISGSSPQLRRTAISTWWHAAVGLIGVIAATPIVASLRGFFS
jgi:hypothetical protein